MSVLPQSQARTRAFARVISAIGRTHISGLPPRGRRARARHEAHRAGRWPRARDGRRPLFLMDGGEAHEQVLHA
jgi:hypothetical protein